jgi:hypothetical protein
MKPDDRSKTRPERAGRAWTWEGWERSAPRKGGNYAAASLASAGLFFVLLAVAMAVKHVAPTPAELAESPLASARRMAASKIFQAAYFPECERAALLSIEEPYRTLASKWGAYEPAAFAPALTCLDEKLAEAGLAPLLAQLRSGADSALLEIHCGGELRDSEVCVKAFALAENRARDLAVALEEALGGAVR